MDLKLEKLFDNNNGIASYSELSDIGFSKYEINKLIADGILERTSKGYYQHHNYLKDNLKLLQLSNKYLVYSHETAAYLLELSNRYPSTYSVSTYSGYHLRNYDKLKVYYVKKNLLYLGSEIVRTNSGNEVIIYNKERTICDFIRNKSRIDIQVYSEVLNNYFKSKPDLNLLSKYAKEFNITNKVSEITLLLMKQ